MDTFLMFLCSTIVADAVHKFSLYVDIVSTQ